MNINLKLVLFWILISVSSLGFAVDDGTWTYTLSGAEAAGGHAPTISKATSYIYGGQAILDTYVTVCG